MQQAVNREHCIQAAHATFAMCRGPPRAGRHSPTVSFPTEGDHVPTKEPIDHRTRTLVALLRAFMGLIFLVTWASNLSKGLYGDGFVPFVQEWAQGTSVTFYGDLLERVVIPNADFFRYFQLVTEFLVMGVFLFVGFLTPVSALVAGGFTLNLLLASFGTGEWPGTYLIMLAVLAVVGLAQAGRVLGVDGILARRNPSPRLPIY